MDWDRVYQELTMRNWIILFLLSFISFFFMPGTATLGVILGGVIIILNFDLLQHTIRCAFPGSRGHRPNRPALIVKGYLRLLALGPMMYFLIKWVKVDPIGLGIGFSTVVLSIISFGISSALRAKTGEAT